MWTFSMRSVTCWRTTTCPMRRTCDQLSADGNSSDFFRAGGSVEVVASAVFGGAKKSDDLGLDGAIVEDDRDWDDEEDEYGDDENKGFQQLPLCQNERVWICVVEVRL